MWSGNLLFWIVALPYTTTFKASIIANTHPILLVLGLLVTGAKVSFGEVVGVLLSFSGILMVSLEDREVRVAEKGPEWVGFLLCFVSASCEVLVIFNRSKTKKYVPLMQYTTATTLVVAVVSSVSFLVLELEDSLSSGLLCLADQNHCLFGWTSPRWVRFVFLFGFVIGVICFTGFNYAVI
eukprot:gene40294-49356_t